MNNSDESYFLQPTLRDYLNAKNRTWGEDDTFFIRIFPYEKRIAMLNNLESARFASGFVPNIHNKILNTKIIASIHKQLVDRICSNVTLGGESDANIEELNNRIVNLQEAIEEATSAVLARGETCLTLEKLEDPIEGEAVLIKNYPLARYDIIRNARGIITEAYLFKQLFDGEGSIKYNKFVLMEHRYEKGGQFYWEYNVIQYQFTKQENFNEDLKKFKLDQNQLPPSVKEVLKDIEINKPHPIEHLGVYCIKNTATNTLCPNSGIGEAQYIDAIDYAVAADVGFTSREMDKNIGRGRVILPTLGQGMPQRIQISMDGKTARQINNPSRVSNMFDGTFMQNYPGLNGGEANKPQNIQFNLRTDEWTRDDSNLTLKICNMCGISIFDYDPTTSTGARTAREIDELTDKTAKTVASKRGKIQRVLLAMLKEIESMLGIQAEVFIKWDLTTCVNQAANSDMVTTQYNSGLISKKRALKELHPNWNEAEIEAELKAINEERDGQSADVVFNNL